MIQILRWPVSVFSQTRSVWPLPRKSPVAAIFHSTETVGRLITLAGTPLFRTQILCCPVTVFSQTSSLAIGVGGAEGEGPTANVGNAVSPVMKLALIVAPVAALYLPTVPLTSVRGRPVLVMVVTIKVFATNRAGPSADNASTPGPFSPVMKLGLIAAPVVALYSLTVLLLFSTKRAVPSADNASEEGPFSPVMKLGLIAAPVVALYSPTLLVLFTTNRAVPSADNASPMGKFSPVTKLGLIAAPVVAL